MAKASMTKPKYKCPECGGWNPEECEVCWTREMERREAARDREDDRRIDEARGK